MQVYTMEQWQKDGFFLARSGQEITEEIYYEMLNRTCPERLPRETIQKATVPVHAGFLMGVPVWKGADEPLYRAFGMCQDCSGIHYYYLGEEKKLEGEFYFMDGLNVANDGIFPVSDFMDDTEAIRKAADYKATLYRIQCRNGVTVSSEVLYEPKFY